MKLTNLLPLYKDIKNKNLTYTIFNYNYNKIKLEVLFDITNTPFLILLIKPYSNLSLKLHITTGFIIDTFLDKNDYNKLREILEIPNGKGSKFCTNDFFEHFNSKIPHSAIYQKISHETRKLLSNACNCEDSNKIYLLSLTNWENKTKGHYTEKNREKVRLLYPEIYEAIKNKNISVNFTDNEKYSKNSKLSDLKEINDENDFKGDK